MTILHNTQRTNVIDSVMSAVKRGRQAGHESGTADANKVMDPGTPPADYAKAVERFVNATHRTKFTRPGGTDTAMPPTQLYVTKDGKTVHHAVVSPGEAERAVRMKDGPLPRDELIRAIGDADADVLSRQFGGGERKLRDVARAVPNTLAVASLIRDTGLDPDTAKYLAGLVKISDADAAQTYIELTEQLKAVPQADRRALLKEAVRKMDRDRRERERAAASEAARDAQTRQCEQAVDDVLIWAATNPQLKRADGSRLKDLRKAVRESRAELVTADPDKQTANDFEKEVFTAAEPMVVTHDWAAAFAKANIGRPEIKLPYDVCAFEFQFGDRRVIAIAVEANETILFGSFIERPNGNWLVLDLSLDAVRENGPIDLCAGIGDHEGVKRGGVDQLGMILTNIANQIVAICIALDAEVAITEAVREPHQKAHGRNFHKPPKAYHVVSLARRTRLTPLESSEPSGARRRLHFRRGHWRHFEAHKTWIKWMLVGDPDLGWVEKEYRL